MSASPNRAEIAAGQIAWTRDLARDLFPTAVTPFNWTLLRRPAQEALRRAWADLGVTLPAVDLWQCNADGYVYLNTKPLAQAGRAVHGAAWLVAPPPAERSGLFGRWQMAGAIKQVQTQVAAVAQDVNGPNQRLADWLGFVQRLRWTQADLLQVMEELEPRAQSALQSYFTVRAGLSAAQADVLTRLTDWLPACPPQINHHLYAGLDGLPSVETAYALAALHDAPNREAALQEFVARYGHRGPGEIRPDARRWRDYTDAVRQLAALPPARDAHLAHVARQMAEEWVLNQLNGDQRRQFEPLLARAQRLCRAVDLAWDGLARVMAATQLWLRAAAAEAVSVGLITDAAEVRFLELEELKQVATGEWHAGRSEHVREEVIKRQADFANNTAEPVRPPVAASPGTAHGPVLRIAQIAEVTLHSGAVVVDHVADPGSAPYWLSAAAVIDAAGDPWTPGMIVARALGVPAVSGMPGPIAQITPGQIVAVDGDTGRIGSES